MRYSGRCAVLATGCWLVLAPQAIAHHAYAANYEEGAVGTIEGIVEEVLWSNPHAHYYVAVEGEGGSRVLWDVETHNLLRLARMGWSRDTIRVGDRIAVTGESGGETAPAA